MTLKAWEQTNRWLVAHKTSRDEIATLLAVGDRDLRDSRVAALSADARMSLAYGSALQFASAALAAEAIGPPVGVITITAPSRRSRLTIGWDAKRVKRLAIFRTKRNTSSSSTCAGGTWRAGSRGSTAVTAVWTGSSRSRARAARAVRAAVDVAWPNVPRTRRIARANVEHLEERCK